MSTKEEQLDLFVAIIGDVPFRDDREMMSSPMVSLAKRSPTSLDWEGPSGQKVSIRGQDDSRIATIYDFDIVIWAISQINTMMERGETPGNVITFKPYELLRAIGRPVGGKNYKEFKAAIGRLQATRISTTIRRRDKERLEVFNLISEYTIDEKDGKPIGASMVIPRWIHRAVVENREVLSISPLYFELSGGLDRFLYRLARRHAGNGLDNPDGWAFTFRDLHSRTGSPAPFNQFSRDLRKAIERNCLPTYELSEEAGANGPLLRVKFRTIEIGRV